VSTDDTRLPDPDDPLAGLLREPPTPKRRRHYRSDQEPAAVPVPALAPMIERVYAEPEPEPEPEPEQPREAAGLELARVRSTIRFVDAALGPWDLGQTRDVELDEGVRQLVRIGLLVVEEVYPDPSADPA
jgi:hypothetical protein